MAEADRYAKKTPSVSLSRLRPLALALGVIATALCLSGCWDRLEIEERAIVLGASIDPVSAEELEKKRNISYMGKVSPEVHTPGLQVTLQIAVPGRIPLGPGEAGGGSKEGDKSVWIISSSGHTIDDAINNLQQEVAQRLFWGHLRVIVISQEVAEQGLSNVNEYLRRNPEVRRTNWIVVSEGEAARFMRVVPQLERVPVLYLLSALEYAVQMGKLPNLFAGVYWSEMSSKGTEASLPYVRLVESGSIQIAGLAMFRSKKMVGKLEPLEIGSYMGVRNTGEAGYAVLLNIPGTETAVMFQITQRQSRIDVKLRDGKPVFHVKVHSEGNLLEKSNEQTPLTREMIKKIEAELNKKGPIGYGNMIEKTQQKGADIFGFGEYLRAKEPGYWNKEIRTKQKWEEVYPDVEIELETTFSVRRIGSKTS